MALTKCKFGDFIVQRKEKYDELEDLPIRGVSREGFIKPKQEDADTSVYNVFYKNDFVFNPARMELNSIALNTYYDKAICSSLYEVFYVARKDIVLPEYLNMYIKRDEFARKCWFEAIGSARNYFRVSALSEFEIELPDLPTQQKYVDIYNSMVANQQSYERGLDDLKLVCDGYIEDLRRSCKLQKLEKFIIKTGEKNTRNKIKKVKNVSVYKIFNEPTAKVNRNELSGYKIVKPDEISFVQTTHNEKVFAFAINNTDDSVVVTSVNEVFKTTDNLCPYYLSLFFMRKEFDRYARFHSWGSARETFVWEDLCEVKIPVPPIEIQKSIANIFKVYQKRSKINEQLKAQIKNICPILIRGSLEEA